MLIRSLSMWSHFCKKYKHDQMGPPTSAKGEDGTATEFAAMEPYIAKQSAAAASAFLTGPPKNVGIKRPTKEMLLPVSKVGSLSS